MAALVQQNAYDFLTQEETYSPPSTVPGTDENSSDFVSSPDYDNIKEEPLYFQNGESLEYVNTQEPGQLYMTSTLEPFMGAPQMMHPANQTYAAQNFTGFPQQSFTQNPTPLVNQKQPTGKKVAQAAPVQNQNALPFVPEQSPEAEKKSSKVSAKRAEQNRQAQKTFRERKMKYVKDLEDKLEEATKHSVEAELLKQENEDLRNVILSLKQENDRLRSNRSVSHGNNQQFNFVWDPNAANAAKQQNAKNEKDGDSQFVPVLTGDLFLSSAQSRTLSLDFNPAQAAQSSASTKDDFSLLSTASTHEWDLDAVLLQSGENPASANNNNNATKAADAKTKRTLEEAKIYNSTTPFSMTTPVFSKDEDANRDDMENQLCDLLRKIHCKDKNPANCQGAKFVKKGL